MSHVFRCSGYDLVKTGIVRAEGCYLYDTDGNKYADFEAGVWCLGLGHNHPRINEALGAQLERVSHLGYRYTADVVEEAAAAVLATLGMGNGKCVFLSSGSEAVEFGVQITRRLTERPLLLTLTDSYLAAYGSAGRKSQEEWFCFDWGVCTGCPEIGECNPLCEHLQRIPFDRSGGLVFEPGNSGGTVRLPPRALVRNLASMVKARDGLIVVDEVTTGMGRTGAWYGFNHYGLEPDVISLGKGLGNGYPVSAVAMKQEVAGKLLDGGFRYAQSHQNDPLGCAVASEVVAVIREEKLVARSERMGDHFLGELRRMEERFDVVKRVRGRGLMIAMEFEADPGVSLASVLHRELLARGFLVGCKPEANLLRFYPPLTIGEGDIAQMVAGLDQALQAMGRKPQGLVKAGLR